MGLDEYAITLTCVSNEVGGNLRRQRPLARRAGAGRCSRMARPRSGADMVLSRSIDGFTAGTPLGALTDPGRDAILAVGMNGEPLPLEHGFPVRMVVPGLYGYVSATKWLTELKVTTFAADQAYWTPRGYSAKAPIKLSSRIDTPRIDRPLVGRPDEDRRRRVGADRRHPEASRCRSTAAPGRQAHALRTGQRRHLGAVVARLGRDRGQPHPRRCARPTAPDAAGAEAHAHRPERVDRLAADVRAGGVTCPNRQGPCTRPRWQDHRSPHPTGGSSGSRRMIGVVAGLIGFVIALAAELHTASARPLHRAPAR